MYRCLYWTAASWCAAIALGKEQPELIAELPMAEALIDRALVLGEGLRPRGHPRLPDHL